MRLLKKPQEMKTMMKFRSPQRSTMIMSMYMERK